MMSLLLLLQAYPGSQHVLPRMPPLQHVLPFEQHPPSQHVSAAVQQLVAPPNHEDAQQVALAAQQPEGAPSQHCPAQQALLQHNGLAAGQQVASPQAEQQRSRLAQHVGSPPAAWQHTGSSAKQHFGSMNRRRATCIRCERRIVDSQRAQTGM